MISLEDKIKCLRREVARRKKVYATRLNTHRMSRTEVYRELQTMSEILDDYERELAATDLFAEGAKK